MLRCFSAVVLDYWKQEMAVTGDETESGRVSLIHVFFKRYVQKSASFLLLLLPFCEICMQVLYMLSAFPISI